VVFNVFDLFRLLDAGKTVDPYRFQALPVETLTERRRLLRQTLLPARFNMMDILHDVAASPLPSPRSALRAVLLSDVWDKVPYPPSVDLLLSADDSKMDEMARNLSMLVAGSPPYVGMNLTDLWAVPALTGGAKKAAFARALVAILAVKDEWSSTRAETVGILLRHCGLPGGHGEDLFEFMLQEEDLPTDFDWYP
jgi:hypothetical protein